MRRRLATFAAAAVLAAAAASAATMEEGLALKKKGKTAAAAEVFAELVEANPKDADALEQLATVQGWLERYDDAVDSWRRALAVAPKSRDYRLGLARVLYWKHDYKASLKELEAVLGPKTRDAEALTLKGDVQLADGRTEAARASYLAAQKLAPGDAELAKKLARTAPGAPR